MRNLSQDDVRRLLKAESGGLRIPLEELTGDERERTRHLVRRLRLPREAGEADDLYVKRLGRAEAIERDGIAQSCQDAGQDWGGMRVEATGIWSAVTDADLDRLTLPELEAVTAGFGRRALREPLLALPCSVVELHEFFCRLGEPGIDAESYGVLYELPVLRSWQDLHNCEPQPLAQWIQALAGQVAAQRGIEPWSDAGIAVLDEVARVIAQGVDTLPMVVPPTWRVAPAPRDITDRRLSVQHAEALHWLREHAPGLLRAGTQPTPAIGSEARDLRDATRWFPQRVEEARAYRDKLKGRGVRDYMQQTAKHYGVTTTRMRQVLQPGKNEQVPTLESTMGIRRAPTKIDRKR